MKPGKELDLLVSELFLGLIRSERPMRGHGEMTHRDASGGWYSVREYSVDQEAAWGLLEEIEARGWGFSYSTMKMGVRGHFVAISYIKDAYNYNIQSVEVEGESFAHSVSLAVVRVMKEIKGE